MTPRPAIPTLKPMETIPINADCKAQLDAYAYRQGLDTAGALDKVVAEYLAWEAEDFERTMADLREGLQDMKAGRTRPANEMFEELREQYGFPR